MTALREARNWSQPHLAYEATRYARGAIISQGLISYIETGRRKGSPAQLAAIAQALATSADFLLGLTDDPRPPPPPGTHRA